MPATELPARRCDRCGARLAGHNRSLRCSLCTSRALREPPEVPKEFWEAPEMRDALATWHMGRVIYAYRNHPWHGQVLKQSVVGSWFGLTQTQLSRIENGRAPEEMSKLVRWARLLGVPADSLWFRMPGECDAEQLPPSARMVPVIVDGRTVLLPVDQQVARALGLESVLGELADAGHGESQPENVQFPGSPRFVGGSILGLMAADVDELERLAAALDDARRYLNGSIIDVFREQLERSKADDGRHGPAKALPRVLGILGAIGDQMRDARPDIQCRLLSLGAEGAEFAGWLYRDLKDPGRAAYWYDRAMEWAQEACDMPMQGYVLLRKSQMAYDARESRRVVAFAEAARTGPWLCPPIIRAEFAQQHALGLAMTGAPLAEVEREMAAARELLASAAETSDRQAPHAGSFTLQTLLLRQAACYAEAGKPATGAQQFGQVIEHGVLSKRDKGFFSARRALALALSGEPDQAAVVGLEAAGIARETSSARTMTLLAEVVTELKPWNSRPQARELRQAVLAAAQ